MGCWCVLPCQLRASSTQGVGVGVVLGAAWRVHCGWVRSSGHRRSLAWPSTLGPPASAQHPTEHQPPPPQGPQHCPPHLPHHQ